MEKMYRTISLCQFWEFCPDSRFGFKKENCWIIIVKIWHTILINLFNGHKIKIVIWPFSGFRHMLLKCSREKQQLSSHSLRIYNKATALGPQHDVSEKRVHLANFYYLYITLWGVFFFSSEFIYIDAELKHDILRFFIYFVGMVYPWCLIKSIKNEK